METLRVSSRHAAPRARKGTLRWKVTARTRRSDNMHCACASASASWADDAAREGHKEVRARVTVEAVMRRCAGPSMPSSDVILMQEQELELDIDVDDSDGSSREQLSDVLSNPVLPILMAVEEEVRSMRIGDRRSLSTSSTSTEGNRNGIATLLREVPQWTRELMFRVPESHEEIIRLQNRYKQIGGLSVGEVVELANGSNALVADMGDGIVTLDCNHPLSIVKDARGNGNELLLNIKLVSVEAHSSADTTKG